MEEVTIPLYYMFLRLPESTYYLFYIICIRKMTIQKLIKSLMNDTSSIRIESFVFFFRRLKLLTFSETADHKTINHFGDSQVLIFNT